MATRVAAIAQWVIGPRYRVDFVRLGWSILMGN